MGFCRIAVSVYIFFFGNVIVSRSELAYHENYSSFCLRGCLRRNLNLHRLHEYCKVYFVLVLTKLFSIPFLGAICKCGWTKFAHFSCDGAYFLQFLVCLLSFCLLHMHMQRIYIVP